jgi:hypothetical protein
MMLSTAGLDLTLAQCSAKVDLTDAQAAMCSTTDAKALQFAIVIFVCGYLWASLHFLLAGRKMQADMISLPNEG